MTEEKLGLAQTLCRACLTKLSQDDAFDIFIVPGLAKKLCVCTSLTVEQQDGFPTNICTTCYSRLNDLHDFQTQCLDSVEKFREMLTSTCIIVRSIPEDNFNVMNASDQDAEIPAEEEVFDPLLNTKIEIEDEQDVFKMIEDVDKETVKEQNDLNDTSNIENSDDNEDVDFEPDTSDSEYSLPLSRLKSKAKGTMKARSSDKPRRKRLIPVERERRRLIECHICTQKFIKMANYEEHMKRHSDLLPHQCPVDTCKTGFTTSNGLRHHIEHTHTELCQMYTCTAKGCDKQFPLKRLLTRHMRVEHNIAKPDIHPCSECDKLFRCPMALKKHMYKHTGEEKPFGCDICKRRFAASTELRDHLLRHAGIKRFVCAYCGVGKTTKQELDNHILTHTREKNFKCDQCEYATHIKQSLTKHIRVVHMKIRKHACKHCEKTFGTAYARRMHERLHTGDSCYECTICSRMFLFEKNLTNHLKAHEKREKKAAEKEERKKEREKKLGARVERVDIALLAGTVVNPIPTVSVPAWTEVEKRDGQVICPECGKSFNRLEGMKLHYKVVHQKIKDYICRFCHRRFGRLHYLKAHENTHTGETPHKCDICGKAFKADSTLYTHKQSHNKPPRPPKAPKQQKASHTNRQPSQRPKTKLNTQPTKVREEYEDPAAAHAAAQAQLIAHQESQNEIKLKTAEAVQKIQTAAQEQLQLLKRLNEKISYDSLPLPNNCLSIPKDRV
ncbi:zinc finger protein 431-like [Drosophila nasuta]|uniref:zinc finger protein 431-like n=1 Tax=Drosophila nasuta TaxID=42062 RepID=UPI00295E55E6|nr:zinc finger protein 431-like [Drosophila nasuta]